MLHEQAYDRERDNVMFLNKQVKERQDITFKNVIAKVATPHFHAVSNPGGVPESRTQESCVPDYLQSPLFTSLHSLTSWQHRTAGGCPGFQNFHPISQNARAETALRPGQATIDQPKRETGPRITDQTSVRHRRAIVVPRSAEDLRSPAATQQQFPIPDRTRTVSSRIFDKIHKEVKKGGKHSAVQARSLLEEEHYYYNTDKDNWMDIIICGLVTWV